MLNASAARALPVWPAIQPLPAALAAFCKRRLRFSTTIFVGRWHTFIPRRVPFHMCLGRPVALTKTAPAEPGFDAEVARVHAAYKREIARVYADHRAQFGYGRRELAFIEDGKSK